MQAAARPHLLRILGPNCIGLLAPHIGLNASFAQTDALPGELAFVSQSGALVTAMLDWARSRAIGFSHVVSLGEHADVDFGDMLDYLASDPRTRAILLYIESIESPRKFMSAARAAARNKPVIVVKAGPFGPGPARRGLAHRRTGRLRHGVRGGHRTRRHAARGHAAAIVPGRRDAGALSRQSERGTRDPDQRWRRRRDGSRRCIVCRRQAGRSGQSHAAPPRHSVAGQLVARQSGGHHRRRAGGALRAGPADPERRRGGGCRAVHPRAHGHRPERRDRARPGADGDPARAPPDGLLARRGGGGRGSAGRSGTPASQATRPPRKRCAHSRCW